MASESKKALAAQYGGNGPLFMPPTRVQDLYAGIYPNAAPRTNPLAPSQGGSWPTTQPQRPRATALSPQNYSPTVPPQIPNDPNRLASGSLPFIDYPNTPIDITVRGGNTQTAGIPMPQPRPWNAPTEMDLAAIAGLESSVMPPPSASAYAPQPAAAQAPQTSWMQDVMTGIGTLVPGYDSPRDMSRAEMYDATNKAAAEAARTQDRSGVGTDGYVRDASGNVIGRDAKYKGLTPSQMYDQISGRATDDSWKSTFSKDQGLQDKLGGLGISAKEYRQGRSDGTGPSLMDLRMRALRKNPQTGAAAKSKGSGSSSLAAAMTRGTKKGG